MFCFQCEQTAGCSGCTGKAGVCGKTADTAGLQDELTGALIGLARACANNERKETTDRIIIEGLFTTVTNVAFDDDSIKEMIDKVNAEKSKIVPGCAACASRCGNTDNYDMKRMWEADEDIRSLKSLILSVSEEWPLMHTTQWFLDIKTRKSITSSIKHYSHWQKTGEWKNFSR